jgi:lipoprotein-releasing system ATP-binding protein
VFKIIVFLMNNNYILKAENLKKSYSKLSDKDVPVLKVLSLEIKKGEFTAIMGPSGVGKSTLLHLLGTLDKQDEGKIELKIDGTSYDYSVLRDEELSAVRNRNIGFIFQFHHLLPEFSALENTMMPALIAGNSFTVANAKAKELLQIVGVANRSEHKPSELSGGEQQRVAIARALINDPTLLIADEPTGNLDSKNADYVLELINSLIKQKSITFVVATHSLNVANIAERILTMGDGLIVKESRNKNTLL